MMEACLHLPLAAWSSHAFLRSALGSAAARDGRQALDANVISLTRFDRDPGAWQNVPPMRARPSPPSSHARPGKFETTHWSLVLVAGGDDAAAAHEALEHLCRAYWPPLYTFARRAGLDGHAAQDAVQGFLARILEREDIARATPERGRFRAFLIGSFKNFLTSQARAENAQKRGGGAAAIEIDAASAEGLCAPELVDSLTPDKAFDRRWARTLMSRALDRLHAEHSSPTQSRLLAVLQPALADGGRLENAAALAAELGTTPGALATAATRLRQRYRALIEDEVARTLEDPRDLPAELRALREAWL